MFNSDENYFFSNFNNSKEQLLSLSSIYTLENNNMNNQNENINDIIIKDNYYNNDIRKENEKQFIFDKENENTGYDSKNKNVPPVNLQNLESNSIIINNKKKCSCSVCLSSLQHNQQSGDGNIDEGKKILGRKRKDVRETGEHTKFSEDNLIKKCKSIFFNYLIIFINNLIKQVYNNNIGYFSNIKQLLNINQEQRINSKVDYYKDFLNKKLKDIFFSAKISSKYKYPSKDHNIKLIQELLNEKDKIKRDKFEKLFDLTFLECLEHFRGSKTKEELEGMISLDEALKDFKNDKDIENYKIEFKNTIKYFENIIMNKKGRNRKK